ncbi:bifunctional (p)ppGpp synthetase/guanosine-3',5'-bis(diphosphate) 3'-pyrophosphohydrolase [Methylophilaceae bacterium]|nr:bifunctional (p)ppGpp synthetase/guanosine-3',5'-bis(diphosphate) 3'-pyrophosphohydrolase [Betaproteobacteria bacterium]MCH9842378.1 bifunctional (p)ppGpp synthetase/guanosine-3',5'-bis(diphosphate) 3'-pyrophosphohydrolase [Betaproteobacteria bacterium]MDA9085368.1 bifunctional (p)ppGpp synthetase/guanosine-3',5'-bis(diphosphate) 3'-pyrophosphohydrolase [Methylophilaceae bacterium]MDC0115250.1 bifunctional (p)ppGpp synthetase/guanosine-3',5'-bis(diphosphate) 3'-pyrophosphohydrolase [Methyloph
MTKTAKFNSAEVSQQEQPPLLPADTIDSRLTLILKEYLQPEEIDLVWRAYRLSNKAHEGQKRSSGEDYISHPVSVACIAAKFHLDAASIQAALLHDVVEDTQVTLEDIATQFSPQVAKIVEGLSKLDKIHFNDATHAQAENFRKMLLAMSQDVRVILIKLADRLHNMQTLEHLKPEKRLRIAQETIDIYSPIANRLGLNSMYQELEDLAFRYIHPLRYKTIHKAILSARGNRKEVVGKILDDINTKLKGFKIKATVSGREKNESSIHRKMIKKHTSFSQINDIYAFRVIVEDEKDCYLALGALHSLYKPIAGKFKDYLAIPKANGYQSLHTTLFGPFGTPLEVQIRTESMHNLAEAGVAAHWLYKTNDSHITQLQQQTNQWLKKLLEIQSDESDSLEFLEHLKIDLFPDEVYVFTPKSKILALPKGSTVIDFAYAVHSDVGNHAVAAKINQTLVPLREEIVTGDHIEVMTAPLAKPNPAWLNFVITGKARSQIRGYLRNAESNDLIILGYSMLNNALKAFRIDPDSIKKKHWDKLILDYHLKSKDDVLVDIALGKKVNVMVAHQLTNIMDGVKKAKSQSKFLDVITIKGSDDMAIELASCCHPIPGDPILGYINKDRGLIIHTHDCSTIKKYNLDPERWVDVEWEPNSDILYKVSLSVLVANETGMLAKMASAIAVASSNIENVSVEESDGSNFVNINFVVQVKNRLHLAEVIRSLRKITKVSRISRLKIEK